MMLRMERSLILEQYIKESKFSFTEIFPVYNNSNNIEQRYSVDKTYKLNGLLKHVYNKGCQFGCKFSTTSALFVWQKPAQEVNRKREQDSGILLSWDCSQRLQVSQLKGRRWLWNNVSGFLQGTRCIHLSLGSNDLKYNSKIQGLDSVKTICPKESFPKNVFWRWSSCFLALKSQNWPKHCLKVKHFMAFSFRCKRSIILCLHVYPVWTQSE